MFELFLLATAAAAVICFLKGHPARGFITLLLLAGSVVFAIMVQSGYGLALMPPVAVVAIALAWGRAEPESYWARHSGVDVREPRPIDEVPMSRRLGHGLLGAFLGLIPGVLFIAVVGVVVEVFDLSGDTAQLAFLGIPITFFGMIGGALVGFQWVPKKASTSGDSREPERV